MSLAAFKTEQIEQFSSPLGMGDDDANVVQLVLSHDDPHSLIESA